MPASRALLVLVAVAAAAPIALAACRSPDEGTFEASIDVNGRGRSYLYHLPPTHAAEPDRTWPLVLVLHGRLGKPVHAEDATHMTPIAEREGFVVVYPEGVDRSWHDMRGTGPAAEDGVDDVGFIRALIDAEVARHRVDPRRVYATGMSNGGMMSLRLACELSDKIAAVGAVGALMPVRGADTCRPAHPMPVSIMVGTEDSLMPYGGGEVDGDRGRVLSAEETRQRFADLAGCGPIDVQQTVDPRDDDTQAFKTAHTRCSGGAEVVLWSISGGGHTWPNGDNGIAAIGRTTRDIDASEELWSFFRRFTLP